MKEKAYNNFSTVCMIILLHKKANVYINHKTGIAKQQKQTKIFRGSFQHCQNHAAAQPIKPTNAHSHPPIPTPTHPHTHTPMHKCNTHIHTRRQRITPNNKFAHTHTTPGFQKVRSPRLKKKVLAGAPPGGSGLPDGGYHSLAVSHSLEKQFQFSQEAGKGSI